MRNRGDAKQDAIRLAVIRRDHTMTDEAVVRTHSPIKTVWGWSAQLTRSIVRKDGTRLVTLAAVRRFILKQPEHIGTHAPDLPLGARVEPEPEHEGRAPDDRANINTWLYEDHGADPTCAATRSMQSCGLRTFKLSRGPTVQEVVSLDEVVSVTTSSRPSPSRSIVA